MSETTNTTPRTNQPFWAGGFLYDSDRKAVLLHKRDSRTQFNPNKWAFFGGLAEAAETPTECFCRELNEEIGLALDPREVVALRDYLNEELATYRYVFVVPKYVSTASLELTEGEDLAWIAIDQLDRYDLTEKTRQDLDYFSRSDGIASA